MKQIPEAELHTRIFGKLIRYFDEIDSTNLEAKRHKDDWDAHGMVFLAEQQNQGRGRLGRSWVSPKETGIWMTILLKPEFEPAIASQLTLVAALAVADAIKKVTNLECMIKWPNDIVVNKKKICGILVELGATESEIQYLVAGIGINVNAESFPDEIKETASSLRIEGGKEFSREAIVAELLNQFEYYYDEFCKCGNLKSIVNYYNSMLINRGKKVKIVGNAETEVKEALGIDEAGRLLVRDEDGQVHAIVSGEVSVRGLYGYV